MPSKRCACSSTCGGSFPPSPLRALSRFGVGLSADR
jgi:hypothetical protein